MIILDTNVLSELMKPNADMNVAHWAANNSASSLFTTYITQAEIYYGLALLPDGKRKIAMNQAVDGLFNEDMKNQVLPFDGAAVPESAVIVSNRRQVGRPISQFDALIAAIAKSRGAIVATRNIADFVDCGIELLNPWEPK